jgi:hypothetical protein
VIRTERPVRSAVTTHTSARDVPVDPVIGHK